MSAFSLFPDARLLKTAFACRCPKCGEGALYPSVFSLTLNNTCSVCGLELAKNDNGDGPAVFLIFLLGFLLVPLALLFEFSVHPPLWVHAVVWGAVAIGLTLGALRPLKAYILALQYKHLPKQWESER